MVARKLEKKSKPEIRLDSSRLDEMSVEVAEERSQTAGDFIELQEPLQRKGKKKAGRKNMGLSSAKATITLSEKAKDEFTQLAFEHGMTFSELIRVACSEYIEKHGWKKD